jgi:hypothetical protein
MKKGQVDAMKKGQTRCRRDRSSSLKGQVGKTLIQVGKILIFGLGHAKHC